MLDSSERREFLDGCRDVVPLIVGLVPFGLVAGVAAVSAGMTPLEGMALSILSFSGIAQLVVCQLVAVDSPVIVTVVAAAVVGLRLVMYSAAIAPHLAHLDRRWRAVIAYFLTDQGFAMAVARFSAPGERSARHWYFLGTAAVLWSTWQLTVLIGILAGARVPAEWSLDFAVTLTFIALLVPAVRTRADLAAALVSGSAALAAAGMPYRLALVVASIAGIAAGLALERLRKR